MGRLRGWVGEALSSFWGSSRSSAAAAAAVTSSTVIGNNDLFIEGQHAWGDNTPASFGGWCEQQPDNWQGGEDCVHTWGSCWNDIACSDAGPWREGSYRSGFICERPANLSRAMARRRAEIWTSLVRQWEQTPSAQGNHYLAACAATVFMEECGSETDTVTLGCIHQRRDELTGIIGQRCVQYGGMMPTGVPDTVARLGPPSDAQVRGWNAEYADCQQRANPVEHYIADSIDQTCACMTTWIVDLCLAAPGATAQSAQACVQGHRSEFGQVATTCLQYGHLGVRR